MKIEDIAGGELANSAKKQTFPVIWIIQTKKNTNTSVAVVNALINMELVYIFTANKL